MNARHHTKKRSIVALAAIFFILTIPFSLSADPGRGIVVNLRTYESADAPVEQSVALYNQSKALVIGIDDYREGWPRLSNAVKDARLVAAALEKKGFEVEIKTDLNYRDLETALKEFFILQGDDPDACLFVWFAGHGHTMNGEGYLIPADAPRPDAGARFKLKALSMRRFGQWVREARSKHVLAVFDSCFSGTVFKSSRSRPPSAVTRATALPVRQFITSGDADQEVLDDGRFRKLFIRAIDGEEPADFNRDGYLTGSELGMYLTDRITNLTGSRQTPRYGKLLDEDYDRGDFVFLLAGGDAVVERPAPKRTTTLAVESPVQGAKVLIDGDLTGYTNMPDKNVSPGRHSVRVEKDGYQTYERTLNIEQGRSISLFVDLPKKALDVQVPATGRLYVDTDPDDALVRILNIAPKFYDGIELDPGRYHLEISASGYETKKFWIELDAGEDKRIDIGLEELSASYGAQVGNKIRNDMGMEFVYIPPGSFTMGSPSSEPERGSDEKQHRVTLTRGFYLQTTEVTVGQWRVFARETGYRTEAETGDGADGFGEKGWGKYPNCNWKNPGFSQSENDPVTCISWNDAREFAKWLSKKDGTGYTLPTEAQWEYVARAGTTTPFSFGSCLSTDQANYDGSSPTPGCPEGQYRKKTVPVAGFSPNAWGLYNMHGNVWEWCQDWYGEYPSGVVTDPEGAKSGSYRVLRGGSWVASSCYCRSARRAGHRPSFRNAYTGFRLARLPGF